MRGPEPYANAPRSNAMQSPHFFLMIFVLKFQITEITEESRNPGHGEWRLIEWRCFFVAWDIPSLAIGGDF